MFQSTPSHGGRRWRRLHTRRYFGVSIHALAWRATRVDGSSSRISRVSIHALAWRATSKAARNLARTKCFNPRPRMEGDDRNSIHSPIRISFNPRPRMEGDPSSVAASNTFSVFQSTPSHGGRLLTHNLARGPEQASRYREGPQQRIRDRSNLWCLPSIHLSKNSLDQSRRSEGLGARCAFAKATHLTQSAALPNR